MMLITKITGIVRSPYEKNMDQNYLCSTTCKKEPMMRKLKWSILLSLALIITASCGNGGGNNGPDVKQDSGQTVPINSNNQAEAIAPLLKAYMDLKDALIQDHSVNASEAGKEISRALDHIKVAAFSADQKKWYDEQKDNIESHALHILTNRSNIRHQREHFTFLSVIMMEMVKRIGADKTIYILECPEYNNNKGGQWISDKKDEYSPYLGDTHKGCNNIKEEITTRPA